MTIATWAGRAIVAVLGASGIAWLAHAAREAWRKGARVIDNAALDVAVKRHPAGSKLPGPDHPQASGIGPGEDTGVMDIDDEYRALLDKEAGR